MRLCVFIFGVCVFLRCIIKILCVFLGVCVYFYVCVFLRRNDCVCIRMCVCVCVFSFCNLSWKVVFPRLVSYSGKKKATIYLFSKHLFPCFFPLLVYFPFQQIFRNSVAVSLCLIGCLVLRSKAVIGCSQMLEANWLSLPDAWRWLGVPRRATPVD